MDMEVIRGLDHGRGVADQKEELQARLGAAAAAAQPDEVLEVSVNATILETIKRMLDSGIAYAPVLEDVCEDGGQRKDWMDKYVGVVDLPGLILWCLQELEAVEATCMAHVGLETKGMTKASPSSSSDTALPLGHRKGLQAGGMAMQGSVAPEDITEESAAALIKELEAGPAIPASLKDEEPLPQNGDGQGFLDLLASIPQLKAAKVSALAPLHWNPYLPVRADDTLLHVLLLFSKHTLQMVPVVEAAQSNPDFQAFITPVAVIGLVAQSHGLDWYSVIADQTISQCQLHKSPASTQLVSMGADKPLMWAVQQLWQGQARTVAVLDGPEGRLIGEIRGSDLRILIQRPDLFANRRDIKAGDFLACDLDDGPAASGVATMPTVKQSDSQAGPTAGRAKMLQPVYCLLSETLEAAMSKIVDRDADHCFLVDANGGVADVLTLQDVMLQFIPPISAPAVDATGAGFFESMMQQTGIKVNPSSGALVQTEHPMTI
eukprot:SM000122S25774  [mRNA]  locus=s122:207188:210371:+ [translate_table: standard]